MQTRKDPRVRPDRGTDSILEILDIATGERRVLREFPDVIEAPNWTRDGKYLVYNSLGRIFCYAIDTGNITEIPTGFATACNNDHLLSPDGTMIAVSHETVEDKESRIYTLPFEGGNPVCVTPMAPSYLHGWSPDGQTLAYCAERDGQYDIYTIPAAGGVETQLTNHPGLNDGPEYSPCGRYLWFNSTRSGLMQIWRMNADGTNPQQMTFDEANSWFPHISPDGKQVVYLSYQKDDVPPNKHPPNKEVELRMMPAEGGAFVTLAHLFGGQGTINVNSWSPDNHRVAFVSYRLKEGNPA